MVIASGQVAVFARAHRAIRRSRRRGEKESCRLVYIPPSLTPLDPQTESLCSEISRHSAMTAARREAVMKWWSTGMMAFSFVRRRLTGEGSGRDLRAFATSWNAHGRKAAPLVEWHCRKRHQGELAGHKPD